MLVRGGTLVCALALYGCGGGSTDSDAAASDASGTIVDASPATIDSAAIDAVALDAMPASCADPTDVSAGGVFAETIASSVAGDDVVCGSPSEPQAFFAFTLAAPQNVQITATVTAGSGPVAYSVRGQCGDAATSLRCETATPATGTLHQLAAGTYFIVVQAPAATSIDLQVNYSAPTAPDPGDTCAAPTTIATDGVPVSGTLLGKENDYEVSCGASYRDAVYQFTIGSAADVTIQLDAGGVGNVSLRTTCADASSQARCTEASPVFQKVRNLAAGTYFVLVEAAAGTSFDLSVLAQAPSTATDVGSNSTCGAAVVVLETGGLFRGNTTALTNDYSTTSGCGATATSRDAAFELTLTAARRVVLSTEGSQYRAVLHVHQTACVSGGALLCNDMESPGSQWSFLDAQLGPGVYFIIVDGFGSSSSGEYLLDVVVDP